METFLEDSRGARVRTADRTWVPPVGSWRRVEPLDRVFRPLFAFRWSYYGEINRRPEFAARMRVNTIPRDARLGGHTPLQNISHSFYRQIPTSKYGKEHPEYFALRGGKRLARVGNDGYGTEPCPATPEARRVTREAVLEELAHRPAARNASVTLMHQSSAMLRLHLHLCRRLAASLRCGSLAAETQSTPCRGPRPAP